MIFVHAADGMQVRTERAVACQPRLRASRYPSLTTRGCTNTSQRTSQKLTSACALASERDCILTVLLQGASRWSAQGRLQDQHRRPRLWLLDRVLQIGHQHVMYCTLRLHVCKTNANIYLLPHAPEGKTQYCRFTILTTKLESPKLIFADKSPKSP